MTPAAEGSRSLASFLSSSSSLALSSSGSWALLCVLALTGCSSIGTKEKASAKTTAPLRVEVQAPKALEELLETHLDIARLDVIAGGAQVTDDELARLIAAAPAQARALLQTEGYFSPEVSVERVAGTPPAVRMGVQPGPRVHVAEVTFETRGPLAEHTRREEIHARAAQKALRRDWPLPPGAPFRNSAWSEGKRNALAQLRASGYLDADWHETDAQVDAATQQARLRLVADSGEAYRTGPLRIRGLKFHDEETVHNLADLWPGTVVTEALLLDFQERLQNSGLFERAVVLVDPAAADPSKAPVTVRLRERQLQQATFGVGVSADVGPRGTLEHVHRRVFGFAATARNNFELSQVRRAWEGELSTHTLPGLYRNFIGGAAERLESDTDVVTSSRVRLGRAQEMVRRDRMVFVEAQRSVRHAGLTSERSDALAVHFHGIWRDVDSNVLPTRGQVYALQVGGGQARSYPGEIGPFTRVYGRARGYWPIGKWYSQARLEAGQVVSRDDVIVPEPLRFRAGGEESVRGYAYRSLTPQVNGVDTSGKVLFTGSVEVARPITRRMPDLWGAVFIDGGRAATRWSDLKMAYGAGVGVRYRSPIGPVSLDLAYGEELRKFRLHLNVGVNF